MSAADAFAPPWGSFAVLPAEGDPLQRAVEALALAGSEITRDVVVGGPGSGDEMVAQDGDFWYHTDAVFWTTPPRWVIVQVLESEGGGELEVADARPLLARLPPGPCFYGRDGVGVRSDVVTATLRGPLVRYRADYMHEVEGGPALGPLHALLRRELPKLGVGLGNLPPGHCLVVDNWTQLHRRRAFRGNRRIRRLWLDGEP